MACLQLSAGPVDHCTAGIPLRSSGQIVIAVTLEKSLPDHPSSAVIGADDFNRLSVRARIDEVRTGTFRFPVGSRIDLAVHSIVLTFGSDYHGDRYEVGLDPVGDDRYRIRSITSRESDRMLLRGAVVSGTAAEREPLLVLDAQATTVVRVRLDTVEGGGSALKAGAIVSLRLRIREDAPKAGQALCVFAVRRPGRADRPYRLLRLVY